MSHINDLSQNNVWEGNHGEKWIVESNLTSPETIDVRFKRMKVEEVILKDEAIPEK